MKNFFAKIMMVAATLMLSAGLASAVEVKVTAPDAAGAAKSAGDKTKATATAAKESAKGSAAAAKGAVADTKAGAKSAATDAKATAAGAKDAAKAKLVDINTATDAELKSVPGIGDAYASKIIAGRPYANKAQLKSRKVLPGPVYEQVKDLIIARQVKK
ncbi:MAG: helix-hairpin-helix domain-containing protein [Geobacteraceae bacterium]|nr:helix-hairpin-helix domain-containing protein [Geobacteraceae bacterium]